MRCQSECGSTICLMTLMVAHHLCSTSELIQKSLFAHNSWAVAAQLKMLFFSDRISMTKVLGAYVGFPVLALVFVDGYNMKIA